LRCPRCGGAALRLCPRRVHWIRYGATTVEEVEDGAVECGCGLGLPINEYVLSHEALLPDETRAAARYWAQLFRLAWDRGIKGDFDLEEPVAPLLKWGILETEPWPDTRGAGPHAFLADHPLLRDRHKVLDIGCGPGRSSLFLARRGHDVVAIEASPDLCKLAKRHAMASGVFVEYVCADLGTVRFRDEAFDAAFALGSLHHMPELGSRMATIHRLLRVGGCLAVDDHHRGDPDTDAVALAIKRWVDAQVATTAAAESRAIASAVEAGRASRTCCSLGDTLPEAERLFHIRHLDTRYTFLDTLTTAYYLHRGKTDVALRAAQDIVGLLSRLWREALPGWADHVTFIGEKRDVPPTPRRAGNPHRSRLRRVAYRYWRGGWPEIGGRLLGRLRRA